MGHSNAIADGRQTALGVDIHPAANIFPMMDDAAFQALKADIGKHGLKEPIVYHHNVLIDGRNRLRACKELGIEPSDCELDRAADPVAFILSANLHRRHLTTSQRAMAAAKLSGLPVGSNQHAKGEGTQICVPMTVDAAAKLFNVSVRSVTTALEVLREASPTVAEQVQRGELAVSRAVKLLKAVPDKRKQTTIANKGKDAIADALGENEPLGVVDACHRLREKALSAIEQYPTDATWLVPEHLRSLADEIDVGVKNGNFAGGPEKPEPIISIIGADNPNNVTCPNCGREVSPDEDGDCPACLHPHIDQVEQAVGQSAPPPAPEPTACTPSDLAIFTPKMKDDLGDIHRALVNVACGAGFQTSDWPAFPDDHPIAASLQAVWEAITAFVKVVNESGIFKDEEADR